MSHPKTGFFLLTQEGPPASVGTFVHLVDKQERSGLLLPTVRKIM